VVPAGGWTAVVEIARGLPRRVAALYSEGMDASRGKRTADTPGATTERDERHSEYLLCITGDRSYRVPLPDTGDLVIGRGADAGLVVDDPLVSRAHAQLLAMPDGLRLLDLGSRHGTLLNGEKLTEARMIGSGDVIAIGGTLLVVRLPVRRSYAGRVLEQTVLVRRLTEELSRAAQYERELAIAVVRMVERADPAALLAGIADQLRVIDTAARIDGRHVAILLPELDSGEAAELAGELAARALARVGSVAIGVASAPFDGIDADTLVAAARAASDAAAPGAIVRAATVAETIVAGAHRILVVDASMGRLYELARRLARSTIPILVQGETGAGKELAAAAIHAFSARAHKPFVSVNCAAIPESLVESELFGHARGAFSGAVAARAGHLEAASGGTLFLDEIGELSAATQAKLLRVLESGELVRLGEVEPRAIDLRLVAATNRDLEREVTAGRFRLDLFYRLGAARLALPPLRDRPRDLAVLSATLLGDTCARLGRAPLLLSIGAAFALLRHDWPGNVRELRHVIEYAAAAAPDSATEIEIWHLPPALAAAARQAGQGSAPDPSLLSPAATAAVAPAPTTPVSTPPPGAKLAASSSSRFRPIADEVRELERARMIAALRASDGLQHRAAELIEMPLRTFVTKLKRYAITAADWST
jgi:two-component system response regulator AtoC